MFDIYDGLGHFMGASVAFLAIFVVMCIIGAITGKDPFAEPQPEPTAIIGEVSESSDLVPLEVVRKMYYFEDRYWVDIDGVTVEIKPCTGPEGAGRFYYAVPTQ